MKNWGFALVLTVAAGAATAAPIYRCGQTYSQTPCPGGHLIDSADPRSAAQRAEAGRAAEREKKLATQMERDRLGASAPASATGFDSRAGATAGASAPVAKKSRKKSTKAAKAASGNDVIMISPRKPAAR
jgi:hypothetical protein